jgi:hypothetical protein
MLVLLLLQRILRRNAMPIPRRLRPMLRSRQIRPRTRVVLLQHIAVFRDPMPLVRRHIRINTILIAAPSRSPRQIIASHLDIIVRELTQLIVIHTQQLRLLGRAQLQAGDVVDDISEDGGHDERVAGAGDDVGELDVELAVVADGPAADAGAGFWVGDACIDAVQAYDVVDAEERVEHQPNDAGEAVLGEDVHGVVDSDPVLD